MPFTYRDKPKLSDRFRGKSSEELLNELASDLDPDRRMFFDSPSWRHRYNNPSRLLRNFPFDEDRKRTDIRAYFDEIAARHPEFADQLKEPPWDEDFCRSPLDRQSRVVDPDRVNKTSQKEEEPGSSKVIYESVPQEQEPRRQNLSNFGLRNTVPLGPGITSEGERHQRSMSAPPDNRPVDGLKKFVTKCEIPIMHNSAQESAAPKSDSSAKSQHENSQQKLGNAPNVRVIPIQVEGRDVPLLNTNFDASSNYGADSFRDSSFEGRLPRDFSAYQRHSPRFAHKERSATPPHQQYAPQYQQYVPPHQHFASGMPQRQQPRHPFYQQPPKQPQPQQEYQESRPYSPQQHQQKSPHMQRQKFHQPPPQQQQQPPPPPPPPSTEGKPGHGDETDSKPQATRPKPEAIKDPLEKVHMIQKDVEELMKHVEAFNGNSRSDKQYLILDELLTRQLLLLDNIDTEGKENVRQARKDTIRSIQRCISTLENKVPLTEAQESKSEPQESKETEDDTGGLQTMEVDRTTKENTPVKVKDGNSMEVDQEGAEKATQEPPEKAPKEEPKEKIQ